MDPKNKNTFSNWLERLQQESWQLELLLSGFAIFLLVGAYEPLLSLQFNISNLSGIYFVSLNVLYRILITSWHVMVINLVLHVLIRGLWISAIGLRYVSGEIDLKHVRLSDRFYKFVKKRTVSFDRYIEQLEQLCSVIFAFTFLIIFLLFSFGLFLLVGSILAYLNNWLMGAITGEARRFMPLPSFIWAIGGLICFIDFISLGWIRSNNFLSKFYLPIFRVYSAVTLSFVYRPLYYNLIDSKFGRKGMGLLILYILAANFVQNMDIRTSSYIPDTHQAQSFRDSYYDDIWNKKTPITHASINSYLLSNGFLELFLPYNSVSDDPVIHHLCPDLKPMKKGLRFFELSLFQQTKTDADSSLICNQARFKISINDSLHSNLKFRFREHPLRKKIGLFTIVDVDYLTHGMHNLNIEVLLRYDQGVRDSFEFYPTDVIPFWVE